MLAPINVDQIKQSLDQVILLSSRHEQCGFLIHDKLVETPNIALHANNTFQIKTTNLHLYLGLSSLIWHTHIEPNTDSLSFADIQLARSLNKPILSYQVQTKTLDYYDPRNPHPYPLLPNSLEGLPYQWDRCDCHRLVRSWYAIALKIELPHLGATEAEEYRLGDGMWNRALNSMQYLGFHQVDESEIDIGTVVLMNLASTIPHHCGVITGTGENSWMMLHHRTDALSEVTRLRKYRKFVHSFWNY